MAGKFQNCKSSSSQLAKFTSFPINYKKISAKSSEFLAKKIQYELPRAYMFSKTVKTFSSSKKEDRQSLTY